VALLKPLSAAISIGTGGPFGAERSIIMTGGAFGSMIAQLFRLTSNERKTLIPSKSCSCGTRANRSGGFLGRALARHGGPGGPVAGAYPQPGRGTAPRARAAHSPARLSRGEHIIRFLCL